MVSEKTQAVLEYPGVSWNVTKSKFYVFSVGNIAVLLCMSSHLLMCIYLKVIIMTDMMIVIVILLQYF